MTHKFSAFFKKPSDKCSICGITRYRQKIENQTCKSFTLEMQEVSKYKNTEVRELALISLNIRNIGTRNIIIPLSDIFVYHEEENTVFGIYYDISKKIPIEKHMICDAHFNVTDDPTTHRAYAQCSLGHQRFRITFLGCVVAANKKDGFTLFTGESKNFRIEELATEWNEKQ